MFEDAGLLACAKEQGIDRWICGWRVRSNRWESVTQLSSLNNPTIPSALLDDVLAVDGTRRGMFVSLIRSSVVTAHLLGTHTSKALPCLSCTQLFLWQTTHARRDACTWDYQKCPLYHPLELYWLSCQKNFTNNNLLVTLVVLTLWAVKVPLLLACNVLLPASAVSHMAASCVCEVAIQRYEHRRHGRRGWTLKWTWQKQAMKFPRPAPWSRHLLE